MKFKEFFLHNPMVKKFSSTNLDKIKNVVGIDFGLNFLITAYGLDGKIFFYDGRYSKDKRAKYKNPRK